MATGAVIRARFDDIHAVVHAVRSLRERGFRDIAVHGPIMEPALEDALGGPPSPVRRYTLIGGIVGGLCGFLLTIWASYHYPLVVGGKPLASIPAYVVIAFELTILFAGISALIGMLIHNRMPRMRLEPDYDASFSDDTFGVRVICPPDRADDASAALREQGGLVTEGK